MSVTLSLRQYLIAIAIFFVTLPGAYAQGMVSIGGNSVNMRSGPGLNTQPLWRLQKGYPLRVIKRQGKWLKVQDFEGDRGWIYRPLISRTPHYIVKGKIVNIRSGPGRHRRVIGQAVRGDLLRTLGKKAAWVKVRLPNGRSGWIAKRLVWGW